MVKRRWLRLLLCGALVVASAVGFAAWSMRTDARRVELNMALADALRDDDLPAIRSLIADGADPDVSCHYAPTRETFLQSLKRILTRQPPPRQGSGETPLFRAAAHGDLELMRTLLARGVPPNEKVDPGYTPLHLAAGMGDTDDMNYIDKKPLHGQASFDACKLLLEAGADPNVGNPYEGTPPRYAIWQKNDALIRLFLDHGAKCRYQDRFTLTSLWDAVQYNRPWLVRQWLSEGANPNERESRHGVTVLMVAAEQNETQIARMLLEAGANPNTVDDGQIDVSPLYQAVEKRRPDLVRLLLDHGARPDLPGGYMMKRPTPLQLAAQQGDRDTLGLLKAAMKQSRPPQGRHDPKRKW